MNGPVRVLLADDHRLMRAGIRALLKDLPGVQVIGEAGDGLECLALTASIAPDVLLLDITMPGLNGLEVVRRVTKEHPRVRVIVLSMFTEGVYVRQALRAGAKGFLVKGADETELELALRAVTRGETYVSPAVSTEIVGGYLRLENSECGPLDVLTSRQREILQAIAEGQSTKDIAQRLDLSVKTIEFHRAELMQRLDIHDVAGLVRFAIRHGLVSAHLQ